MGDLDKNKLEFNPIDVPDNKFGTADGSGANITNADPTFEGFARPTTKEQIIGSDPIREIVQDANKDAGGEIVNPAEMNFAQFAKLSEKNIPDAFKDYSKLRRDNGLPDADVFELSSVLMNNDGTKSLRDNEKEERTRQRQERWEQVGNLLSHIGNFAGTLVGAPSQELESGVQLTARQKQVRDAILAQRRADSGIIVNNIWKQRAEEREREVAEAAQRYKNAELGFKNAEMLLNAGKAEQERILNGKRGQVYDAQVRKINSDAQAAAEKAQRERELQPWIIQEKKAQISSHNSSTNKNNRDDDSEWGYYYVNFPSLAQSYMKNNKIGSNKGDDHWDNAGHRKAFVLFAKNEVKKKNLKPEGTKEVIEGF